MTNRSSRSANNSLRISATVHLPRVTTGHGSTDTRAAKRLAAKSRLHRYSIPPDPLTRRSSLSRSVRCVSYDVWVNVRLARTRPNRQPNWRTCDASDDDRGGRVRAGRRSGGRPRPGAEAGAAEGRAAGDSADPAAADHGDRAEDGATGRRLRAGRGAARGEEGAREGRRGRGRGEEKRLRTVEQSHGRQHDQHRVSRRQVRVRDGPSRTRNSGRGSEGDRGESEAREEAAGRSEARRGAPRRRSCARCRSTRRRWTRSRRCGSRPTRRKSPN